VQRRGAQRGHQAHRARHDRQRPLALGIEEPFGFEPRLALQELLEERALSGTLQAFDHQLQIAARFIHRQPAAHFDLVAVARRKIEQAGRAPEHRTAQLAGIILEREVTMPTRRARKTGNLAAHRNRIEASIQRIGDRAAQGADGPDARTRRCVGITQCHKSAE
jgi:hypothetical protein